MRRSLSGCFEENWEEFEDFVKSTRRFRFLMNHVLERRLTIMSTAEQFDFISVEEYLRLEEGSDTRHEYIGGVVYAMSGGRNVHNLVATNLSASLWNKLRGGPCRVYNSDTKIRIRQPVHTRFYYPDVSVICRPNPPRDHFQDQPSLVVEVLSTSTRRTDSGEKCEAYLSIPSLDFYLMVEPEEPVAILYRRKENGFEREVVRGVGSVLSLAALDVELPMSEVYEGVDL